MRIVNRLGWLVLAMSIDVLSASACGLTSHVVVGNLAIDNLADKDLKKFLEDHREAFLLGTMVPDSIQTYMKEKEPKLSDDDKTSHGRTTSKTEPKAVGYTALWLNKYREDQRLTAAEKKDALAYYLGIVTHLIADGPWHHTYIDRTTASYTDLSTKNRHTMADNDVDLEIWKKLTYGPAYACKVPIPDKAKGGILGGGHGESRLSLLHAAVHEDNPKVDVRGGVSSVLSYNHRVYNSLEQFGKYSAHADECDDLFKHAFTGKGALNDCARESAAFLDAIWHQHKTNPGKYWVVRTDTYDYAVVTGDGETKTVAYASKSILK